MMGLTKGSLYIYLHSSVPGQGGLFEYRRRELIQQRLCLYIPFATPGQHSCRVHLWLHHSV